MVERSRGLGGGFPYFSPISYYTFKCPFHKIIGKLHEFNTACRGSASQRVFFYRARPRGIVFALFSLFYRSREFAVNGKWFISLY